MINYQRKISGLRARPTSTQEASVTEPSVTQETENDRARIIQSSALRRLQQKTQVYPLEDNAGMRSRLAHSLEVQQTGRTLAGKILQSLHSQGGLEVLGLDGQQTAFTNLVEMACLMHDLGNPPFGHFGERIINDWLSKNLPGCLTQVFGPSAGAKKSLPALLTDRLLPDLMHFEGNAQGLRILHSLHCLNLTLSQLGAMIKYTRPAWQTSADAGYDYRQQKPGFFYSEESLYHQMEQHLDLMPGHRHPLVYIMEAADDIAYCVADLEDAVDKGIFTLKQLQSLLNLEWKKQCQQAGLRTSSSRYLPDIVARAMEDGAPPHVFITRFRTRLFDDLVSYASDRYCTCHAAVFDGSLDEPLIDGESEQHLALLTLKWVARRHVFSRPEVETPELRCYAAMTGLLDVYKALLVIPCADFRKLVKGESGDHFLAYRLFHRLSVRYTRTYTEALNQSQGTPAERDALEWYHRCRLLLDYVSGMTDHFVLSEYRMLAAL
ncbi:MAG: dGTPase [Kistimonas sp.]|nr:dGTPase [Kistimonas sp.]